jgi:predicted amidophosphoribosyltransferase
VRILLDALFPSSCAACSAPASTPLCARCETAIAPAPPAAHGEIAAAAMFCGPLADAVRVAKFRPDVVVAEQLGAWWAARIATRACTNIDEAVARGLDAVTFVPAPWRRRVRRGFDLPAVLAQSVARAIGRPVVDALACARTDAPFSFGADKGARATVVQGRYRARRSFLSFVAQRTHARVLLVDDVTTTGATLAEAQRTLEGAGVTVLACALAMAP